MKPEHVQRSTTARRCLDGGMGQHHTLRFACRTARRDDKRIAGLGRRAVVERCTCSGFIDDLGCAESVAQRSPSRCGESLVERQHRIARLPYVSEGGNEEVAGGSIDRHESATVSASSWRIPTGLASAATFSSWLSAEV